MMKDLFYAGLIVVCVAAVPLIVILRTETPTVRFTYPDETCVRVLPEGAGTCEDLPERYVVEWVSPRY